MHCQTLGMFSKQEQSDIFVVLQLICRLLCPLSNSCWLVSSMLAHSLLSHGSFLRNSFHQISPQLEHSLLSGISWSTVSECNPCFPCSSGCDRPSNRSTQNCWTCPKSWCLCKERRSKKRIQDTLHFATVSELHYTLVEY